MEALTGGIQAVGNYVFQVGEAAVVGVGNTLSTLGAGTVSTIKAIFLGVGIGG